MKYLLLLLCFAPSFDSGSALAQDKQDQTAEAKKLLDSLAPPLKDPATSQIEWETGNAKGVGYFHRGKAWRTDQTFSGTRGQISVWDGKGFLQYMQSKNRFFKDAREPQSMLLMFAGGLAEIHYSGGADRLLQGTTKATVKKEKLDDVDCSHIVLTKKELNVDLVELHFWIDADKNCRRYQRKTIVQGKPYETSFSYKVVDPPATTEEMFSYKPPADAKDLRDR